MDKASEDYQASLDICNDRGNGITRLLEIMRRLRDKDNGCAWDLEQDYQSLVSNVIEEAYEVVEAIESNNVNSLKEELGDLLFGIVFYPILPVKTSISISIQSLMGLLIK